MNITVLGCGPAGLLAAHAAFQAGHTPRIVSRKVRSKIGGAQYLHTHIPDLTHRDPEDYVEFEYRGDARGYAQKVYGVADAPTSWGDYQGRVPIWNMRQAYDELWKRYESYVEDQVVTSDLSAIGSGLILSTVPRKLLCDRNHQFISQEVSIWYAKAERKDNQIIYNGNPDTPWYRYSHLFGWESIEWPNAPAPDSDLVRVVKPLYTDCTCYPKVVKLGRYGRWEKKILSHDAYWMAVQAVARAEQGVGHHVRRERERHEMQ